MEWPQARFPVRKSTPSCSFPIVALARNSMTRLSITRQRGETYVQLPKNYSVSTGAREFVRVRSPCRNGVGSVTPDLTALLKVPAARTSPALKSTARLRNRRSKRSHSSKTFARNRTPNTGNRWGNRRLLRRPAECSGPAYRPAQRCSQSQQRNRECRSSHLHRQGAGGHRSSSSPVFDTRCRCCMSVRAPDKPHPKAFRPARRKTSRLYSPHSLDIGQRRAARSSLRSRQLSRPPPTTQLAPKLSAPRSHSRRRRKRDSPRAQVEATDGRFAVCASFRRAPLPMAVTSTLLHRGHGARDSTRTSQRFQRLVGCEVTGECSRSYLACSRKLRRKSFRKNRSSHRWS